jgi:hypothetical protein
MAELVHAAPLLCIKAILLYTQHVRFIATTRLPPIGYRLTNKQELLEYFVLALPVNRNNSIKLFASTSLHTSAGTNYNLAGILWQYRWGGGL